MTKQHSILETQDNLYSTMLFSNEQVARRINELAEEIVKRYTHKNPLFVCLLRGGAPFSALLMFAIVKLNPNFHPEMDYMTVRCYGDKRVSNQPSIVMRLSPHTNPRERPSIILDDVLDTGETAVFTAKNLIELGATEVDLCVLVKKHKEQLKFTGHILYGFEGPAGWLTGMGLDDTRIAPEANRWAAYIAAANDPDD
jgi:hypoxanthine phosphoribosyltransferase